MGHSEGCHQHTLKGFELTTLNFLMTGKRLGYKRPPVKAGGLTELSQGFVLPEWVKQMRHESAIVSFCDPVQSTGF